MRRARPVSSSGHLLGELLCGSAGGQLVGVQQGPEEPLQAQTPPTALLSLAMLHCPSWVWGHCALAAQVARSSSVRSENQRHWSPYQPLTPLLPVSLEQPVLSSSPLPSHQECRCVRELSIGLFTEVMEMAVGSVKRQMEKQVRGSLLLLFFHLHDEMQSVAQVWLCNLSDHWGRAMLTALG